MSLLNHKYQAFGGFSVLLGFAACNPDFDELRRGLSAVDSSGAAGNTSSPTAGAGSAQSNAGAPTSGGEAGDPSRAGASASEGGTPNHGGSAGLGEGSDGGATPSSAGADSTAGGGSDAIGGADSGGKGGSSGSQSMPVTSASTEEIGMGNVAGNAVDGSSYTKWCASDGTAPQWWQLDLGSMTAFTGVAIEFESALAYDYQLQVSSDGSNFSVVLDKSQNTNSNQQQVETIAAHGRYVRLYFPSLPAPDPWPHWACLLEFGLVDATSDPSATVAGVSAGGNGG